MSEFTIPKDLSALLDSGDYVLFAGAGVGVEAGIPDWGTALSLLAQRLADSAPSHAGLMFEEAKNGRYLEAAEILYLAPISDATRAVLLQEVFGMAPRITRRLKLLASTRCQGIVTTNFDRSLELAVNQANVDLVHYTEGPSDLANARVSNVPYLIRLHGRIEVPDSLVLAHRHFNALPGNEPYVEFFRQLFLNRNLVFFGFSFRNPILSVLIRKMAKAVRSVFRRRAFALLPDTPPDELRDTLLEAHIDVVAYPSVDDHRAAWDLFAINRGSEPAPRPDLYETETLRSELASVYARVKAREFSADRARVLSGLMVPILVGMPANEDVSLDMFATIVEEKLALPAGLGRQPLFDALRLLEQDGVIRVKGSAFSIGALPSLDALEVDANRLLSGIVHRNAVRSSAQIPEGVLPRVRDAIVFALTLDGLHLAHSMIRRAPLDRVRLRSVIDLAVKHASIGESTIASLVADLMEQLMKQPDPEEERVLANVSVVVFATALLLGDPAAAQHAAAQFEAGAFVDASVVLPWISEGHPLQRAYDAILSSFGSGRIRILDGYLNELVNHRRLAIQAMKEGLDDDGDLRRYVGLFELHNINTFIGGFAAIRAAGFVGGFNEYLATYAPFDTDAAAGRFLQRKGLLIEKSPPRGPKSVYSELRGALRDAGRIRQDVVVEHDARQLEVLARTPAEGMVFITADRALLAAASRTSLVNVVRRMFLPHQAAYLAQFAAKGQADFQGIVRAMWAQGDDVATKVRRFYTDRILKEYEFALAAEIPAVVNAMLAELEKAGIDLAGEVTKGEGETERLRVFTALDRFEPRFYEKLADAKRRAGIA